MSSTNVGCPDGLETGDEVEKSSRTSERASASLVPDGSRTAFDDARRANSSRAASSYASNWDGDIKVQIPDTGISLAEAMSRVGIHGRTELIVGAGHGWVGPEMKRTMSDTYEFFDQYLRPKDR